MYVSLEKAIISHAMCVGEVGGSWLCGVCRREKEAEARLQEEMARRLQEEEQQKREEERQRRAEERQRRIEAGEDVPEGERGHHV